MSEVVSSVLDALVRRAEELPDVRAYTFIDYDADPAGYSETLTWSEVYGRARVVAENAASHGAPGDRVAIVAPQGLDYIIAFFGAMLAGRVAVPLPAPVPGGNDERVIPALQDSTPTAILTTSAVVNDVVSGVGQLPGTPPVLIEVDALDLTARSDFAPIPQTELALLQYTSGSTRKPAGVMISQRTIAGNTSRILADLFAESGGLPPPDNTVVSWLPFYHDMGLVIGVMSPVIGPRPAVLTSPVAFLQKPARWMQLLARHSAAFTAAPNFAFELATRRTSDDDMAGLDLGDVHTIISGGERIHAATVKRFLDRFARFNLPANALAPSYGLAEAMYAGSAPRGNRPTVVRFDYAELVAGHAKPRGSEAGVDLVSIGGPRACAVRIVDPDTHTENPDGEVGEVWLHGDNVATGYWQKPEQSERVFGGQIVDPTPGTPATRWLRTGDLGVLTGGEFFIVGRIKDLLIVDGRNHYPDDIEATIQELTGGRAVAIAVPDRQTEQLVTIVELKNKGTSDQEILDRLQAVKQKVTSAVAKVHGLRVADMVLVSPGTIPITTSGKVRRSACVERYRRDEFSRLDAVATVDAAKAFR